VKTGGDWQWGRSGRCQTCPRPSGKVRTPYPLFTIEAEADYGTSRPMRCKARSRCAICLTAIRTCTPACEAPHRGTGKPSEEAIAPGPMLKGILDDASPAIMVYRGSGGNLYVFDDYLRLAVALDASASKVRVVVLGEGTDRLSKEDWPIRKEDRVALREVNLPGAWPKTPHHPRKDGEAMTTEERLKRLERELLASRRRNPLAAGCCGVVVVGTGLTWAVTETTTTVQSANGEHRSKGDPRESVHSRGRDGEAPWPS